MNLSLVRLFQLLQRKKGESTEEWFEKYFVPVPKKKPADCKGCAFDGKTFGNGKTYCSHLRCSGADHELKACRWKVVSEVSWPEVEEKFKGTSAVKMLAISLDMIRKMPKKR